MAMALPADENWFFKFKPIKMQGKATFGSSLAGEAKFGRKLFVDVKNWQYLRATLWPLGHEITMYNSLF